MVPSKALIALFLLVDAADDVAKDDFVEVGIERGTEADDLVMKVPVEPVSGLTKKQHRLISEQWVFVLTYIFAITQKTIS